MLIIRVSPRTGIENSMDIDVTNEQLAAWDYGNGELIQNAMPNVNADEREFILTGYTPEDWEGMYGSGD